MSSTSLRSFLVALAVSSPAAAQLPTRPAPNPAVPHLEVLGDGESRIAPDRATVTISVETKGASAATVAAENARIQTRVLDTLRALGFTGPQVTTVGYHVAPNYEFEERGRRQAGYVARNSVRVRITRLDRIGAVIDAALARGANGVEDVQFEASNTEAAEREALAQAVTRARAQADALARALGGSLGPLLDMSTMAAPMMPYLRVARRQAVEVSNQGTPVTPGEITVATQVVARWGFSAGRP